MNKAMKYIVLIILLFSSLSQGGDYLEPEASQLTGVFNPEYKEMVIQSFIESYNTDAKTRVIVFPSRRPEYAVFIREKNKNFTIYRSMQMN